MDKKVWDACIGWKAEYKIESKCINNIEHNKYIVSKEAIKPIAEVIYQGWGYKNTYYGNYKPGSPKQLAWMAHMYYGLSLKENLFQLTIKFLSDSHSKLSKHEYNDLFINDNPRTLLKNIFYEWFLKTLKSHEFKQLCFERNYVPYKIELDTAQTENMENTMNSKQIIENINKYLLTATEDEYAIYLHELGIKDILLLGRRYNLPSGAIGKDKYILLRDNFRKTLSTLIGA